MNDERGEARFLDLVGGLDAAMLTTRALNGDLRARPMALGRADNDGTLWFATSLDSRKVDEIRRHSEVNVSFQGPGRFLSLSGRAEILDDHALLDSLWSESWGPWFPEGRSDPELRVLKVEGRRGEYWDMADSLHFSFLLRSGRTLVETEPVDRGGSSAAWGRTETDR
jgi:general stress protein 26